jgi:hypothetical protein
MYSYIMDIKQPTTETKSIGSLLSELDNKYTSINMNPPYQRGFVWKEKESVYFIDSIMNNLAPSVITLNLDTKTGKKVCIDGKQRLTSVKNFKDNKFPIKIGNVNNCYYDKKKDDTSEPCSEKHKSKFNNCILFVVTYSDLTYEEQVDLFKRLQGGKMVQNGEKMSCVIVSEDNCICFNEYCDIQGEYMKKFLSCERNEHKTLISRLFLFVKNETIQSMHKSKTDNIVKELFDEKDDADSRTVKNKTSKAIEKIFNVLKSDKISKSLNDNILLIAFHKMYQKYNNKWSKLDIDKYNIIQTIADLHKDKSIKTGTSEKVLLKIADMYDTYLDKNMKQIKKSKTEDDICYESVESEEEEEEEDDENEESDNEIVQNIPAPIAKKPIKKIVLNTKIDLIEQNEKKPTKKTTVLTK